MIWPFVETVVFMLSKILSYLRNVNSLSTRAEVLVGSSDIQSLAEIGNSFEVVRTMGIAPVTKEAIFRLAAATLAPIVPLVLTMLSLEELLKRPH